MRHIRGIVPAIALAGCMALATPALAADTGTLLEQRIGNPRLGSDFAMLVIDAGSGEVVSEHRADQRQLPASTMKIITAVSLLANVDPGHRFTTSALLGEADGKRQVVVLRGGGDPLLSKADLADLASATASALRNGNDGTAPKVTVRTDRTLFPDTGRAPGWTSSYIPSSASTVQALGILGSRSADPSAAATAAFASALRAEGVKARIGEPVTTATPNSDLLAEVSPHAVDDAVARMLSVSDNDVAEILHRHVALSRGQTADWAGAQAATEATLRDLGLDPAGQQLHDGSGLSRTDRLTPRFLVDVLRLARTTSPERFAVMFDDDAMPVAGRTGTLDDTYGRFVTKHAKCAQGMARGKTGTLSDTISLAGVTSTVDGSERIYTMLINHRPTAYSALSQRQVLDGLVATAAGCWN